MIFKIKKKGKYFTKTSESKLLKTSRKKTIWVFWLHTLFQWNSKNLLIVSRWGASIIFKCVYIRLHALLYFELLLYNVFVWIFVCTEKNMTRKRCTVINIINFASSFTSFKFLNPLVLIQSENGLCWANIVGSKFNWREL